MFWTKFVISGINIKYIFFIFRLFLLEFGNILIQSMNLPTNKAGLRVCEALSYDEALIKITKNAEIIIHKYWRFVFEQLHG